MDSMTDEQIGMMARTRKTRAPAGVNSSKEDSLYFVQPNLALLYGAKCAFTTVEEVFVRGL
jgi:hypothetical protein